MLLLHFISTPKYSHIPSVGKQWQPWTVYPTYSEVMPHRQLTLCGPAQSSLPYEWCSWPLWRIRDVLGPRECTSTDLKCGLEKDFGGMTCCLCQGMKERSSEINVEVMLKGNGKGNNQSQPFGDQAHWSIHSDVMSAYAMIREQTSSPF